MLRSWTAPHQKEPIDQVILPHGYREAVLRMAHMAPWAGHFGCRRTTDRILNRFFWPGVRQDVADLCRRCQTCQRTAQGTTRKVPLVPLPVISTPFTRIAMDMVGPLPVTDKGHKYILTIVDYGSRYPDAILLSTITSEVVADALVEYFSRVGLPEEILTDRGSNFNNQLIDHFYDLFGIRSIKTPAYHPETDRMVERYRVVYASISTDLGGSGTRHYPTYCLPFERPPTALLDTALSSWCLEGTPVVRWTRSRRHGRSPPDALRASSRT